MARLRRLTEGGRLVIGAYLHHRRAGFRHGDWTPWVDEYAQAIGVNTETLGRWMLKAEQHFGLELTKAAKPTLRGRRRPAIRENADTDAAGDATNAPAGRDGIATAPAAAPGGGDSPGAGEPDHCHACYNAPDNGPCPKHMHPRPPECPHGCDDEAIYAGCPIHDPGTRAPLREDPPSPAPTTPRERSGEPATKAHTPDLQPDRGPPWKGTAQAVGTALDWILDAHPVELAKLAQAERTKVMAAHRALGRALTDTGQVPARESAGRVPDAPAEGPCPHPKGSRQVKPYATICGDCGVRVR